MIEAASVLILEAPPRDLVRKGPAYQPRFGRLAFSNPFLSTIIRVPAEKNSPRQLILGCKDLHLDSNFSTKQTLLVAGDPQCKFSRGANEKTSDY
jgi:hypothetical protein